MTMSKNSNLMKAVSAPSRNPKKRYKATPDGKTDREHLTSIIQGNTGCTVKAAKETMDALLGTITSSLKKNQKVQFFGFGSFKVAKRPRRKGRNPQTGESIRIKASKSVRFKAGETLKRSV